MKYFDQDVSGVLQNTCWLERPPSSTENTLYHMFSIVADLDQKAVHHLGCRSVRAALRHPRHSDVHIPGRQFVPNHRHARQDVACANVGGPKYIADCFCETNFGA